MLKGLLVLSGLVSLLQRCLTEKIVIDHIAQGDTLYLDLLNDGRWPVFEDFEKRGFNIYPKPEMVRCLPDRKERGDFQLLDSIIHGQNQDKFLVKYTNGTVALLDSYNITGTIHTNSTLFKDFKADVTVLFGRIYSYKGWGFYSFRVYFIAAGSSEVRVYDHKTQKESVSLWQPKVDPSKVKLEVLDNQVTQNGFLALVATDSSLPAVDHLHVLKMIEPQGNETEVKEVSIDLAAGLKASGLTIETAFTHLSAAHTAVIVGEKQVVLDNLLFGGVSASQPNLLTLFSCLISEDYKAINCMVFYNATMDEDEYLLDARPLNAEKQSTSTLVVQLASKTDTGVYVIKQIDLNSTIKVTSLRPVTYTRTPYEQANIHEFNVANNATSGFERFDGDGFIVKFGQSGRYLTMNNYAISDRYSFPPMTILLPANFKQMVRASKFSGSPGLVVVDEDHCFRTFKYKANHYIEVETSKYANNSEIVLWYYRRQGASAIAVFNDTLVLNYTGGHKELILNARSLKATVRDTASMWVDADPSLIRGYYETGPELVLDGDVTPSYAKINANKMRFFLTTEDNFQEISSSNMIGAVDRAIDLQNMHGYTECSHEISREIGVTCRKEFRVQFKNNKAVNVLMTESMTFLALNSRDKPVNSSLGIINHATRSFTEIDLPLGASLHSLQVSMNYLICLYVSKDGTLESVHVGLETFKAMTTNYHISDIVSISSSPNYGMLGFGVLTQRETYFMSINTRYNLSDPASSILGSSNPVPKEYSSMDMKTICYLPVEAYKAGLALSDGNKLYWSAFYKGMSTSVGINYGAPLANLICGSNGFFYTQGQNLVKVPVNDKKASVIAERHLERHIYTVGGKTDLIYSQGGHDYALVYDGTATTLKMLNKKGTSFILSRAPEKATLEYQAGSTNKVNLPIDLTLAPRPDSKPVNLSKMGNYTYADNKLNFTIAIGSTDQSTEGHFWAFEGIQNPAIKVQNRFTYLKDVSYGPDFQVIDVATAGQLSAYLVKSFISNKYSLVFKGPDFDEKLVLFHSREVFETPYITSFSYHIEESLPVFKAVVFVANSTFNPMLLIIKCQNGNFTTESMFDSLLKRTERRFATVENTTFYALQRPQADGSSTLGMRSDTNSKWWTVVIELSKLSIENVEAFDLLAVRDYVVLISKKRGSKEIQVHSILANNENATFVKTFATIDGLRDNTVTAIKCAPGQRAETFSCVFAGDKIFKAEFRLENEHTRIVVTKLVNFMPYKNMVIEDAIYVSSGVIFVGRRSEVILNTTQRDQYGIMYYPLNVEGDYYTNSAYMIGGLDKVDLEKLNLGMNLLIRKGEGDQSVILGTPESGFSVFSIDDPTVFGTILFT